jgi:hypothetical protein
MAFAGSLSWLRGVQSVSILIVVIPAVDVAQNLVGGCQLSEGLVGLVHVVRILQKKGDSSFHRQSSIRHAHHVRVHLFRLVYKRVLNVALLGVGGHTEYVVERLLAAVHGRERGRNAATDLGRR